MQILFKDSTERLDQLINETLEDIDISGKDYEVALIFKDDFVLEDYEHLEDLQLYNDEVAYKVKLIELLIMLYSFKTDTRIGSVLRAYRMANGLSIVKLAEDLETPYRTYQDWELGNRNPTAKDLFKIIRYLNIDIKYVNKAFEIKERKEDLEMIINILERYTERYPHLKHVLDNAKNAENETLKKSILKKLANNALMLECPKNVKIIETYELSKFAVE